MYSSLFYKQPFYKQPGSNSWKFKQFLSNCQGWNCLETKQSDAEAVPQESEGQIYSIQKNNCLKNHTK